MTTILSMAALTLFIGLFFLDLRRSKGDKSLRFGIRALAGLGSSALLLAGMLVSRHWDIASLVVCLIFSDEILMMFPCSYEKPKPAFDAALTVLIVNFAILIYFGWKERGIYDFQRLKNLITVLVLITSFLAFSSRFRFESFPESVSFSGTTRSGTMSRSMPASFIR